MTDPERGGVIRADQGRMTRYFRAISKDFFDLTDFQPVMDHPFSSYLRNRTYQDIFRETAPCCLRAEDRNCSAFELDHADPFFDYRLMEFMFRVPGAMKIRDGVTKRLLRDAMAGTLPEETRTRIKKTGWNAPAHVWFTGHGREQLRDMIASQVFRERGIYIVPEVERLVGEHEAIVSSGAVRENHTDVSLAAGELGNLVALARCPTAAQRGRAGGLVTIAKEVSMHDGAGRPFPSAGRSVSKILFLLTHKEKVRLFLVLGALLINGLVDVLGASSILPFIAVVAKPSMVETNVYLKSRSMSGRAPAASMNFCSIWVCSRLLFQC